MAAPAIIHGNGRDGQYETARPAVLDWSRRSTSRLGEDVDAGFEREISQRGPAPGRPPFLGHRGARTNSSSSGA